LKTTVFNPVFDEPFDGARQHHAFDVAADGGEGLGAHGMVDPLDVLLDDRPFVEFAGDEMRGGADQLDAALVGLRIRPRALETGQEGVVDIDRLAAQCFTQARRQYLHVARQYHQVDLLAVHQFTHLVFLRHFHRFAGAGRQWQVMKRDIVAGRQLVKIHMVRNDGGDFHRQQAAFIAEQQIVKTVADFRHHQHHPRFHSGIVQLPVHPHRGAQRRQALAQGAVRHARLLHHEMHAHEEQPGFGVAELGRVDDIAAVLGQETRHAVHDAALVEAGNGQDVFKRHRRRQAKNDNPPLSHGPTRRQV
jgi:hypothetical protein